MSQRWMQTEQRANKTSWRFTLLAILFSILVGIGHYVQLWYGMYAYGEYHPLDEMIIGSLLLATIPFVFFFFIGKVLNWRLNRKVEKQKKEAVQGVLETSSEVSVDEIARETGLGIEEVREIVGKVKVKEREKVPIKDTPIVVQKETIEKKVLLERRVPTKCPECGSPLDAKSVIWTSSNTVRCPNCESTLEVKVEEIG